MSSSNAPPAHTPHATLRLTPPPPAPNTNHRFCMPSPPCSVPTSYDATAGVLSWALTPTAASVYFAYFAPYSMERHENLLAELSCREGVACETIGNTLDCRHLDMLRIGG